MNKTSLPVPYNTVDEFVEYTKRTMPSPEKYVAIFTNTTDIKVVKRIINIMPDTLLNMLNQETNKQSKYDLMIINEINHSEYIDKIKQSILQIYKTRKV